MDYQSDWMQRRRAERGSPLCTTAALTPRSWNMSFLRNEWYKVGAAIFVALAFIMGFWGSHFSQIQVILIFSYMALLVHQYEEYALPGGAVAFINYIFYGEKKDYDRYPLNKQICLLINGMGYVFYIIPILFPNLIWWGLATMFFGFFQLLAHGVVMNVKARTWYNPGLAAVVFLHTPIGIYYIYYVQQHSLATWTDYAFGIVGFVACFVFTILLPLRALGSHETPYPFSAEEMNRFNVIGKLKAKGLA
jgi:hypothetical protein